MAKSSPETQLADAALKCLAKTRWDELALADVAKAAKIPLSQVAAMGARDVARNRQPQSHAALLQIAALVEAMKRPERFLAAVFGNARTVVVDRISTKRPLRASATSRHARRV
jgi:hypothetical protein